MLSWYLCARLLCLSEYSNLTLLNLESASMLLRSVFYRRVLAKIAAAHKQEHLSTAFSVFFSSFLFFCLKKNVIICDPLPKTQLLRPAVQKYSHHPFNLRTVLPPETQLPDIADAMAHPRSPPSCLPTAPQTTHTTHTHSKWELTPSKRTVSYMRAPPPISSFNLPDQRGGFIIW